MYQIVHLRYIALIIYVRLGLLNSKKRQSNNLNTFLNNRCLGYVVINKMLAYVH